MISFVDVRILSTKEELGSIMDRSPKCIPKLAGVGIEYEWAMSKLCYRKQSWESKKEKGQVYQVHSNGSK